jgi:hypothetical protein
MSGPVGLPWSVIVSISQLKNASGPASAMTVAGIQIDDYGIHGYTTRR